MRRPSVAHRALAGRSGRTGNPGMARAGGMQRALGVLTAAALVLALVAVGGGGAERARAQDGALATAALAPADAPLYAALNLDPASDQIAASEALLRRAGLGDALDDLAAMTGATPAAGEPGASPAAGDDPLVATPVAGADVAPFFGGEAALVLTADALDAIAAADLVEPVEDAAGGAGIGDGEDAEVKESESEDAEPEGAEAEDAEPEIEDAIEEADVEEAIEEAGGTPTAGEGEDTMPTGAVLVLIPGDADAAFETALEAQAEEAELAGLEVEETESAGITVTAVPADPFTGEEGSALARVEDALLFAPTAADLEPVIDVGAGGAEALADGEGFARVREALPDPFLLWGYADGTAFRGAFEASLGAALGPAETATLEQSLAALDARFGFTVRADDPGFRFEQVTVPVEGAALPPVPANYDPTLDERVPRDTLLFLDGFDLGRNPAWDAIGVAIAQGLAESDPGSFGVEVPAADATQAEQAEAGWEALARFLTFNPRTDLLANLVGEYGLALSVRSLDPAGVSAVFVSGVEDAAAVNDALSKLALIVNVALLGMENESGVRTESDGERVTHGAEFVVPDSGSDEPLRVEFGVVDGAFVVGYGDGFDAYVAGPDGSLADNPRYAEVMGLLPAEHNGVAYLDLGQLIALLEPVLEESMAGTADAGFGTPVAGGDADAPDLSAIEAFAAVSYVGEGDVRGTSAILRIGGE